MNIDELNDKLQTQARQLEQMRRLLDEQRAMIDVYLQREAWVLNIITAARSTNAAVEAIREGLAGSAQNRRHLAAWQSAGAAVRESYDAAAQCASAFRHCHE